MSVHPAVALALPRRTTSSWLLERRSTPLQAPLAAACAITVAAHLPVTGEHLEEAPYIGALFVLLEVASVVLALALIRRPSRAVLLSISAVGALAVLALVISRTIGLPLIGDDVGNWTEPLALVSAASESLMVLGGLVAGLGTFTSTRRAALAGVLAGLLLLGGGALVTAMATASPTSADAHDGMDMQMDMGGMGSMHHHR